MTTIAEGQMKLSALLMQRRAAGKTTELEQIDAVLCEDFAAVHSLRARAREGVTRKQHSARTP